MSNFLRGFKAWKGPKLSVIEVERVVPLTGGEDSAIATLKYHPGFIALCNKFRLQRQALRAQLEQGRFEKLEDVYRIQLAIAGLRILESEVDRATQTISRKEVEATVDEREAFDRILMSIEGIGADKP